MGSPSSVPASLKTVDGLGMSQYNGFAQPSEESFMKNLNKNVAFGIFVVVFMALWNLVDFLWTVLIEKGTYQFGVGSDLAIPFVVAIVSGYLLFLRRKG